MKVLDSADISFPFSLFNAFQVYGLSSYLCSCVGVDGSVLLDVCHLPDTGNCIQCVCHSVASSVAAAGAVYTTVKNPQVIVLKMNICLSEKHKREIVRTWVFSTVFLSIREQKSDEKRMTYVTRIVVMLSRI